MKLYGLRYLKDEGSCWSDYYAFSNERDKLMTLCKGIDSWVLGAKDVTNGPKEVFYTGGDTYPKYSVVEVPFVI